MNVRHWILPALAAVLVAGHGVILYYVSSRLMLKLLRRLRPQSDRRSRGAL
jgi:hypothetical protein